MTPGELSARQRVAEAVARDAGRFARGHLDVGRALEVTLKGPQDVVTAADGVVERRIVAALRSAFPDDAFLGEEGGGTPGDRCWVIDPIDGTANFARGLPHWCVSIAFVAEGRTEVGVIHDPNGDLLYSTRRGDGARRNSAPLRVSATDDPARATVDIGYSRRTGSRFAAFKCREARSYASTSPTWRSARQNVRVNIRIRLASGN